MGWESCPRTFKPDNPGAAAELGVTLDGRKVSTAPVISPLQTTGCPEQKPRLSSPTAPITRTKRTLNFPLGFSKGKQKKKKMSIGSYYTSNSLQALEECPKLNL